MNETIKYNNNIIKLESKYISLINSLSYSIKELYLTFTKIFKSLNSNISEQNNYIFTSKCLINEINNKNLYKEKFQKIIKSIEGINITNKYIIKNISDFDESSKEFFKNSKIIFTKMKELKSVNINLISFQSYPYNNNLFFSEIHTKEQELFTSKTNNIRGNSHKRIKYINLRKNKDWMNMNTFNKKQEKRNNMLNTTDNNTNYLNKKIFEGKNFKKFLNHSQDEIITDLRSNSLKKRKYFLDFSPHKNSSWSKDKKINIYRNSNLSSFNKAFNKSSLRYYKLNKTFNKNNLFKSFKHDSFSDNQKFDINNILEFLENVIDYFYLIKISEDNIINETNNVKEKEIDIKIKHSLIRLNYSIFILNDFFIDKIRLKRKLNYIIKQSENFEQKLKYFSSAISGNSKELDYYIYIIKKLKNDNNNLANINQKIISENKILLNKLSIFENNQNSKNIIAKLVKENKEYKVKINNIKKDNDQLHLIIKKIHNNNDKKINSSYFLNNSQISNIINYNTDINNNNYLTKKKKDSENIIHIIEENKILKMKLNEKVENLKNSKMLEEDNENLKNKCKNYLNDINEKESKIKSLNLNINDLKNELKDSINNYNYLQENIEKNKLFNENQIMELKLIIDEKNKESQKLKDDINNKDNKINENLNLIEKLENSNKNIEKEKNEILEKSKQQIQEINQLESIINVLNEKLKNLDKKDNNEIINDNCNKIISTPSFKSPEEENEDINNLKKENELLLNKIKKYEFDFKLNKTTENNINEIENINDKNRIIINKNTNKEQGNNYISTLSSMKINKLYSSNEFIILSDVSFNQFKWYLMKKKTIDKNDEVNDIDSYENLIWVPIINIIDLEKFEYKELNNSSEIVKLIKINEEKEKIISKLSYKLEKFEKELKNKQKVSKSEEGLIPIEKYDNVLEELNEAENNIDKIQKENSELLQYKKMYLKITGDNNPININKEEYDEDKKKNENENTNDEIDYYKKKCEEFQTLLNVLKEGIKNILMKIVIPKKDREEIKQILKLCEFTNEETLKILGDKKI